MLPYIGSGPYCYSNSLAMVLGDHAPAPAAAAAIVRKLQPTYAELSRVL